MTAVVDRLIQIHPVTRDEVSVGEYSVQKLPSNTSYLEMSYVTR